jgi:hypothetical protein
VSFAPKLGLRGDEKRSSTPADGISEPQMNEAPRSAAMSGMIAALVGARSVRGVRAVRNQMS